MIMIRLNKIIRINHVNLLTDQIFWENQKKYIQILESSYFNKTNLDDFFRIFYYLIALNLKTDKIWEKNLETKACDILTKSNKIRFQLNSESFGFEDIISLLYFVVNLCEPEITLEMNLKNRKLIILS